MQKRAEDRYNVSDFLREHAGREEVRVELSLDSGPVRAGVKDLSVRGMGLEIHGPDRELAARLETMDDLFIKIIMGDRMLVANTRRVWSAPLDREGSASLAMGLEITMIAPEDSLVLVKIIEGLGRG